MNVKLDTLILYVKNTELLKNFYVENFNLKVIEEDHIWVLLDAGSANIGLHKIGDEYLKQIDSTHTFDNNTKIVFEIDTDIETARNELIEKNVQVREIKTFDHYPFWLCDGKDPEGNVFQLKSRK
ncbi:VOC family protein [Chryseobacterium sp. JK1]|uniref:VOC family protein n=1 Tax=Chryseobacterium sp. JK1 TaxID=874294 RepID=UPI003D6985ED